MLAPPLPPAHTFRGTLPFLRYFARLKEAKVTHSGESDAEHSQVRLQCAADVLGSGQPTYRTCWARELQGQLVAQTEVESTGRWRPSGKSISPFLQPLTFTNCTFSTIQQPWGAGRAGGTDGG